MIDHYICNQYDKYGKFFMFEKMQDNWVLRHRYGYYITNCIDSGVQQMEWNRLTITSNRKIGIRIYVLFSDDLQEIEKIEQLSLSNQKKYIQEHAQLRSRSFDMLLYDNQVKGRYIKCMVEYFLAKVENISFGELHLTYPKTNFIDYFPTIYHDSFTLQRYLAVYQSIYQDIDDSVSNFLKSLDFSTKDTTMLHHLASWMNISTIDFKEEDLQKYMLSFHQLQRCKGTKRYYEILTEVFLDTKGFIIENTPNKNQFVLLLPVIKVVDKPYIEKMIQKHILMMQECKIIWLDTTSYLDGYCYLDYNSYLVEENIEDMSGVYCYDATRMV